MGGRDCMGYIMGDTMVDYVMSSLLIISDLNVRVVCVCQVEVSVVTSLKKNGFSRLPGLCRRLKRRRVTVLVKTHISKQV